MKYIVRAVWIVIILTAAAAGFAQDSKEGLRMVFTDSEAIGMLEGFGTDMIAGPQVSSAEWSPSGRYVLAARMDVRLSFPGNRLQLPPPPDLLMPGEASLILWNGSTRRSQEVWSKRFSGPQEMVSIEQVAWLSGRDVAFAVVRYDRPEGGEHQRLLLRIEGSRRQAQPIGEIKSDQLFLSPVHPLAVLVSSEDKSLRVLKADGSLSQPLPLPQPNMTVARWSEEGILCFIAGTQPSGFDPRSGNFQPYTEMPRAFVRKDSSLPIRIKRTEQTIKEGPVSFTHKLLWLESVSKSELPLALISADSDWGKLSPDGSEVLYASQGAAWVKQILRTDKEQLLHARTQAAQTAALSSAKQIALALLMYAQDYDDTLPSGSDSIQDILKPYVKNDSIFFMPGTTSSGFVYTYGGGPLSAIDKPAETSIGYFNGPSGRAIIYADGHVVWEGSE